MFFLSGRFLILEISIALIGPMAGFSAAFADQGKAHALRLEGKLHFQNRSAFLILNPDTESEFRIRIANGFEVMKKYGAYRDVLIEARVAFSKPCPDCPASLKKIEKVLSPLARSRSYRQNPILFTRTQ